MKVALYIRKEVKQMKYRIENVEEFREQLTSIKDKIDLFLKFDTTEKELTDKEITNIAQIKKQISEYCRMGWSINPKIKIVSSDGTELTVR